MHAALCILDLHRLLVVHSQEFYYYRSFWILDCLRLLLVYPEIPENAALTAFYMLMMHSETCTLLYEVLLQA